MFHSEEVPVGFAYQRNRIVGQIEIRFHTVADILTVNDACLIQVFRIGKSTLPANVQ